MGLAMTIASCRMGLMNLSDYDTLLSILRYVNGAFEKRKLLDI